MHLAELTIEDLRGIRNLSLQFTPGLNILIGANNVGKTAVVDALRALIAGPEEFPLRLDSTDLRVPRSAEDAPVEIILRYTFRGLSADDEADFLPALQAAVGNGSEVRIVIRCSDPDNIGRLRMNRWCGANEDVALSSDMTENLRGVYLPPLRDASQGLRPNRFSQLSRLMSLLATPEGKTSIEAALKNVDIVLKQKQPVTETQNAVQARHENMIGSHLAQRLDVGLSANDFKRMASRLSMLVDDLDIDQNGLGFNNLIFMAVVLSELSKDPDSAYRGLIIEEPEAHLHPQLQAVLLRYLEGVHSAAPGERPVQVFVTSHSPNFASVAKLDTLCCLFHGENGVEAFLPGQVHMDEVKREKLERYLDVTRAELFFASRAIFVEGIAELLLMNIFAERASHNLRRDAVSVINVEGLNFDCFLPLFGKGGMRVPVAVITDADPGGDDDGGLYPEAGAEPALSANTTKMLASADEFVRIFHGVKTFEYDLALSADNREAMITALKDIHPSIGKQVEEMVEAADTDSAKAKALFRGMFERKSNNVQKGRFGQALAQVLSDKKVAFTVPQYIRNAIEHVSTDIAGKSW